MDTKGITMTIVSLVIGVVLITGIVVPVINSLESENGGGHTNPDTDFKLSYATAPTDFQISCGLDFNTESFYVESNGRMEMNLSDAERTPETIARSMTAILFLSEDIYIGMIEGYFTIVWSDGAGSMEAAGSTGTVVCENGTVTVTMDAPIPGPYIFDLPEWYYYADAGGDFGAYSLSQIEEGIYTDGHPLCPVGLIIESDYIFLYGENYIDVMHLSATHDVTAYQTIADDGLIESITWAVDDIEDVPAYVLIAPKIIGGANGTGVPPTIIALLSIIPLLMVVGLVVTTVGYFLTKRM